MYIHRSVLSSDLFSARFMLRGKCWFLWIVDDRFQAIIAGLLELSNGCISLSVLPSYGLRYILSAGFLSFGGLCVAMQTMSVAKNVKQNLYFPGKVLQASISLVLACLSQYIIFPAEHQLAVPIWLPTCCIVLIGTISAFLRANKKVVAFAQ